MFYRTTLKCQLKCNGEWLFDFNLSSSVPPKLLPIDFESEIIMEGDFAQSSCVLRKGDKPITMSWLFNGYPLSSNDDIQITKMGSRSSILTIDSVKGSNQGNYTCVASNQAGSMAVHASLIVEGHYFYPTPEEELFGILIARRTSFTFLKAFFSMLECI